MPVQELRQAHAYAAADGYIAHWELPRIRRAALLHDNTVDAREKAFLKDAIERGFWADPGVLGEYQRLAFFGEQKVADEMLALRGRKQRERWSESEYRQHVEPMLLRSTDRIAERLNGLFRLDREVGLFNSDVEALGKQLLLNSHDPIADRLAALRTLDRQTGLFNSDVKAIGMAMIRNSFDRPEARRAAVEELDRMVHLWNDEKTELYRWIERDDQSLEG